ncbi:MULTISPECIES: hypothetical protein [unclassified Nocardia]|uniref:hypothetical protein n=1 Tax=unclassified Nocardia TaxID=2637762 RepID=UPI001CE3CEF9|nr:MULTISPECIES: hypothetical protein [unclassified Nocardia]
MWREGQAMGGADPLLAMIAEEARRHGYSCRVLASDELVLTHSGASFAMSLVNLRRLIAREPRDEWRAMVADHLSTGIASFELEQRNPFDFREFGDVSGLVRTRLYPSTAAAGGAVRRFVAPGLTQRIVLDNVHAVRTVTYDMLRDWPISERDLFELAERNVRADGPLDTLTTEFDDPMAAGLPFSILFGPEYTTAHALWLAEYPVTGRAGALLIIPSKRFLYTYPINDLDVLRAAVILARLAVHGYAEQPWPVSQFVYHWHGRVQLAATTFSNEDGITMVPTDDFHTLLNALESI